jgi:hypothetical protein
MAVILAAGLLLAVLLSPVSVLAQSKPEAKPPKITLAALAAQVAALQTQVNTLQSQLSSANVQNALALGKFVAVDTNDTLNGLKPPHIILTGANIHIRSGSGKTVDNTGLGNLVIGYDEDSDPSILQSDIDTARTGSHNLVVGELHRFTASGGMVAGRENFISGQYATITGGDENIASGLLSSVTGGGVNEASGDAASVTGGASNHADGNGSSVSGGVQNFANALWSSVSGGEGNTTGGKGASVSGGNGNTANGVDSSIGGGMNKLEGSDNTNIN